jgi:hypothetical protein
VRQSFFKERSAFNVSVFIILILLWVLPGIIYLLATIANKKVLSVTVRFDGDGKAEAAGGKNLAFLVSNYNHSRGIASTRMSERIYVKASTSSYLILAVVVPYVIALVLSV